MKKKEEKNKQVKAKHSSITCKLPKKGMTHSLLVKKDSYLLVSNIIAAVTSSHQHQGHIVYMLVLVLLFESIILKKKRKTVLL